MNEHVISEEQEAAQVTSSGRTEHETPFQKTRSLNKHLRLFLWVRFWCWQNNARFAISQASGH